MKVYPHHKLTIYIFKVSEETENLSIPTSHFVISMRAKLFSVNLCCRNYDILNAVPTWSNRYGNFADSGEARNNGVEVKF